MSKCFIRFRHPMYIFPGGPEIGLGGAKNFGFILHCRWEAAIDIKQWVVIMPGVGLETNFGDVSRIISMMKVNSVITSLIGFRTGHVYDTKFDKSAFRLGLTLDLLILGVSFDWDYYPDENKWKRTILGTISI